MLNDQVHVHGAHRLHVDGGSCPQSEAVIGCGTVLSDLKSCLPYLTNKGSLGDCCDGVKSLNTAAKTKEDRQSVCGCLKSLASSYSGLDLKKAAELPGQCGISVPYQISPSTDCNELAFFVLCCILQGEV
ncbi:hypothetical protein Pfo_026846, partial [Paulownia fortunei]